MNIAQESRPDRADDRRRGVVWIVMAAIGALLLGYLVVAMPGMDHSTSPAMAPMPGMGSTAPSTRQADPAGFEKLLMRPDALVINVHVPYEGEIVGTDAVVAYDSIVGASVLPADKSALILVYCKTGRMSAIAAAGLTNAGYVNVTELDGGTDAWQATGRPMSSAAR